VTTPKAAPPGNGPLLRVVGLLLLLTAALFVWVGFETVRASGDTAVRSGLDYHAFLEALDDLTEGTGDSTLLVFRPVEERVSRARTLRYDTIEIIADVRAFPSFDEAGFLHDQVQIYNRFQRERVALARAAPEWFDRLRSYNPSVFRSYRRADGTTGLTRASSAWSLRVRSPLEGEWNGEILASDVHRGRGLFGPRLAVPLRKPVRLVREVDGRRQLCELVPYSSDVRAYCLSEERIPQATLRLASDGRSPDWAVAGWGDLWVDGRRIRSGDSVGIRGGTIFRLNPLEPAVFGEYWEGVLSSRQWVNGRMRRQTELPPPLDLFSAIGSGPSSSESRVSPDASIHLSLRAEASADLTIRLSDFLESELKVPLDFGMMVLARIPDGEIVAAAEVGERRNRGRSALLERVAPGSAVKPLLAAAILSQRPELAELRIPARSGPVSSVLGMPDVPRRRAFTTALNCAPPVSGWVDLRYFLRCSNNEFAASLLVAGLENPETPGAGRPGRPVIPLDRGSVPRSALLRSPLSAGINQLFDLPTDPVIADSTARSRRAWEGLAFSDGTPVEVPYELLPSESRPALLAPGSSEGTELALLYRYAYGAWENQWTLLDLTTAFARVVSDRRVQLKFFPSGAGRIDGGPPGDGEEGNSEAIREGEGGPLGLGGQAWYGEFLAALSDVAEDGTAGGLRTAWRRAGLPPRVLAKTGTLSEAGEPGPRDDLFAKSLLFSVGMTEDGSPGPMTCGLVGGLYLRFTQGPEAGSLRSYQVQFAREELGSFLREYWEELGACEESNQGRGTGRER
jgi:hypothetical protein